MKPTKLTEGQIQKLKRFGVALLLLGGLVFVIFFSLYISDGGEKRKTLAERKIEKESQNIVNYRIDPSAVVSGEDSVILETELEKENLRKQLALKDEEYKKALSALEQSNAKTELPEPDLNRGQELFSSARGVARGNENQVRQPDFSSTNQIQVANRSPEQDQIETDETVDALRLPPGANGQVRVKNPRISNNDVSIPDDDLIKRVNIDGSEDNDGQLKANKDSSNEKEKKDANNKLGMYIPAGSFFQAIMISGVDAPTGGRPKKIQYLFCYVLMVL